MVNVVGPGAINPSGRSLDEPPPIPSSAKRPATMMEVAQMARREQGPESTLMGGDMATDLKMATALLQRIAIKTPALRDRLGAMIADLSGMAAPPQAPMNPQAGAPAGGGVPMPPPPGAGMGM